MKQLKNFLIKREQSQTRLSFAECEKSRLIAKLTLTLVALLSMTAGAWAQETVTVNRDGENNKWTFQMPASNVELQVNYEPSYNVTFNTEGLDAEEAAKFTANPNTGVYKDQTVTVTYTGSKRLIGFKAVKKEAAPSVPDGAINGKFSVSATKQVYFSKGNLYYDANATTKWYFAANQYDYIGTATGYPMDLFTWGNIDNPAYDGSDGLSGTSDLSGATDWGSNIGTGWYTLCSDEWTYLFNTRSASTVGDTENARYTLATINTDGTSVNGIILFPDGATFAASEATTWGTINDVSDWTTKCTTAQWTALEAKGCVFLPAAGYRSGSSLNGQGTDGVYWSSTADGTGYALQLYFISSYLNPAESDGRGAGFSVRLVRVAE